MSLAKKKNINPEEDYVSDSEFINQNYQPIDETQEAISQDQSYQEPRTEESQSEETQAEEAQEVDAEEAQEVQAEESQEA